MSPTFKISATFKGWINRHNRWGWFCRHAGCWRWKNDDLWCDEHRWTWADVNVKS